MRVGKELEEITGTIWTGRNFKDISLLDYKQQGKYLLILSYPNNFNDYILDKIQEFQSNLVSFHETNCEILFLSTESKFSHKAFYGKDTKFSILTDSSLKVSKKLGVLNEATGKCFFSSILIDNEGIVKLYEISDSYYLLNINELIRLIKSFQFSKKYSVVCQSNWVPGKKGINYTYKDPRLPIYWKEELEKGLEFN